MRLLKAFVLVALLAGAYAPFASAGGYTDESYFTPVGKVGTPYSHTVSWKPGTGCPPYGYSVVGGAFPPGLSLSSSGHITGTPTQAGTYTFYIRQTDNCGIEGEGNAPFVIKIQGGAPPLVITSSTLGNGEADLSYSVMLSASGGGAAKSWSVTGGALPAGLTLSNDGHLSGTPTAPGNYSFTATVSDGTSSSSKGMSLTIIPGITVNATPTVPTAEVRTSYSASVPTMLGVTGGVPPYRYAPVSGFPVRNRLRLRYRPDLRLSSRARRRQSHDRDHRRERCDEAGDRSRDRVAEAAHRVDAARRRNRRQALSGERERCGRSGSGLGPAVRQAAGRLEAELGDGGNHRSAETRRVVPLHRLRQGRARSNGVDSLRPRHPQQ